MILPQDCILNEVIADEQSHENPQNGVRILILYLMMDFQKSNIAWRNAMGNYEEENTQNLVFLEHALRLHSS